MTRDDDTVGQAHAPQALVRDPVCGMMVAPEQTQADAESFELPEAVDALLCFYTNDILISPTALPRAFGVLRPGARIVVAGVKLREP